MTEMDELQKTLETGISDWNHNPVYEADTGGNPVINHQPQTYLEDFQELEGSYTASD